MHAGARIGRYEVHSVLGRGGMGEVYRGRDTKLDREVALKVLPPALARDAERLARLEHEAKLLAALNHPNVAAIFALEDCDGVTFLVLELVEGVTLADRLSQGRLRFEHALAIAVQIAAGLEAAHDADVVHRDLKLANIAVTRDLRVKVLDFGLAKTVAATRAALETKTVRQDTTVTGSAAYMSPEQIRGEETGRQTDIWSFGVVLYELLTGESPFACDTTTETLARVLEREPDFARVPSSVRHIVRRCLEKDLRRRYRDIGDVKIAIEEAAAALPAVHERAPASALRRAAFGTALAAAGALAFAAGGWWLAQRGQDLASAASTVRFGLPSTGQLFLAGFGVEHVAVSRDGSTVAHALGDKLTVRRLSEPAGIELEVQAADPFFSPDGAWLGFFADGLRKVASNGGTPTLIAPTTDRPAGAAWSDDGTIVFATAAGLYRVSADGGDVEHLTRADPERGELLYAWPRFLPDGRSVLFTIVPQGSIDEAKIARLDLETRTIEVVAAGGTSARYVATGHLLYAAAGEVMAVRFDPTTATASGDPRRLGGLRVATVTDNGAADFAVSDNGVLAYIEPRTTTISSQRRLWWVGRDGREEPLDVPPDRFVYARVSPDGTRIALDINRTNRDIWVWDIGRETLTRLTDGPTEDMTPVWSADSRRVFFASNRTGNFDVYSQPADGSTQATVTAVHAGTEVPNGITPDGLHVLVTSDFHDVGFVDVEAAAYRPLLQRAARDWLGEPSPDGRWFAYESDESGAQFEVYVRPFPDASARREQVSVAGGRHAVWGPPGSNELYYVALDGSLMAVPIELTPELKIGRAVKLFDYRPPERTISGRFYDVSPVDGRFLIMRQNEPSSDETETVQVVLNWFAEARARLP
jgi:serine/threonine-protein kinase